MAVTRWESVRTGGGGRHGHGVSIVVVCRHAELIWRFHLPRGRMYRSQSFGGKSQLELEENSQNDYGSRKLNVGINTGIPFEPFWHPAHTLPTDCL